MKPDLEDRGACPHCGAEVIVTFDADGPRVWIHEVWRTCACPMPEQIAQYGLAGKVAERY